MVSTDLHICHAPSMVTEIATVGHPAIEYINEGDWVWVETPQIKGERVRFQVKLFSGIDPRVVHAAHGCWFPENPLFWPGTLLL